MRRIWKARPKVSDDLLAQLLANRKITDPQDRDGFFSPRYENTYDPYLLKDMDRAVSRINQAVLKGERITIYADYDADAVTAAAVLLRFLEHLGYPQVDYYIPDRSSEGYGMNMEAVKLLAQRGTNLIITVDCGINAFDAIDLGTYLGIDTIVTDHHQLTGGIPRAVAVVNPHRPDDEYPFKDLTGVGVAFKLVQALSNSPLPPLFPPHLSSPTSGEELKEGVRGGEGGVLPQWIKWLLDLVAIGTVADCQSLLGENRIFVKWGLHVLQKTRWLGLQELLKLAGIRQTPLDTYKIGFIIAPRINAAGRIEHANLALELLLTDDPLRARQIAQNLEELNRHRQQLTEQILSEAREQLASSARDKKILLAAGSGWPKGIVGLVAGKLTEEFYRPVLVLEKGEEEATGSARSIAKFNIITAISQSKEILVRYGGHPMAAGFTLRNEHIDVFHQNLLQYAEEVLTEEDLSPILFYDAEISLDQINPELVEGLEKFAPFGLGNPRPRLRINNLIPQYVSAIGQEGKHLRMYVSPHPNPPHQGEGIKKESSSPLTRDVTSELRGEEKEGVKIGCIGFNLGFWAEKLQGLSKIDIICELQYNDWRGEKTIQLKVVDIKPLSNLERG